MHSLRPTQWAQGREGEWGQRCLCREEGAGQGCWVPNVHLSPFSCQGLDQTPGWLGINGATCKKMCSLTFLRHLPRNQGNKGIGSVSLSRGRFPLFLPRVLESEDIKSKRWGFSKERATGLGLRFGWGSPPFSHTHLKKPRSALGNLRDSLLPIFGVLEHVQSWTERIKCT